MSKSRLIPVIAFLAGIAVGWAVTGRARAHHDAAYLPDVTFEPDKTLMVYRPRKPQDGITLVPYAVSRGDARRQWKDAPANPEDVWLVSWDDGATVVSCVRVSSDK